MSEADHDEPYRRAWIWGIASITIVSLCSLGGAVLLPCLTGKSKGRWMHMFIALAVATLSTDAILHLIPEVLGLHNHNHEGHEHGAVEEGHDHGHNHSSHEAEELDHEHGHGHSHDQPEADEIWEDRSRLIKLSAICAVVFVLYFLEFIAHCRKKNQKVFDAESSGSESQAAWEDKNGIVSRSVSANENVNAVAIEEETMETNKICGLTSVAFVIIFGDAVHNFVDGVAIGASFVMSNRLGISTSLAVVAHELPHELGDLAVLLHSGLSVPKALLLNLLSALTAYAGLVVGIAAVHIDSAVDWLLAITAGMFLYVAWIDMMVHLKHSAKKADDPWWLLGILQFVGIAFGFVLIFLIGWFEHSF